MGRSENSLTPPNRTMKRRRQSKRQRTQARCLLSQPNRQDVQNLKTIKSPKTLVALWHPLRIFEPPFQAGNSKWVAPGSVTRVERYNISPRLEMRSCLSPTPTSRLMILPPLRPSRPRNQINHSFGHSYAIATTSVRKPKRPSPAHSRIARRDRRHAIPAFRG